MPALELLPAEKRTEILAELANTVPASTVTLLKGWKARTIGPRTMRRLLDADVEIERLRAELEAIRTADLAAPSTAWLEGRNG